MAIMTKGIMGPVSGRIGSLVFCICSNGTNYVRSLPRKSTEKLRDLLPDAFISSVVIATSPDTKPWKRKTTLEELKVLVQYVDQLSFLYYDTYIHDQKTFEENCAYLLNDIKTLKQTNDIQYLISIGTFVNVPELHKYRNLEIEAIPNSLENIKKQAFLVDSTQQLVNGISIFCDWETDESEWKQFYRYWSKNN